MGNRFATEPIRARLNIYIIQELKDYVDEQARNYGMSTSAYMTMIIQQHRLQSDALASIETAKELMNKMEAMGIETGKRNRID